MAENLPRVDWELDLQGMEAWHRDDTVIPEAWLHPVDAGRYSEHGERQHHHKWGWDLAHST